MYYLAQFEKSGNRKTSGYIDSVAPSNLRYIVRGAGEQPIGTRE